MHPNIKLRGTGTDRLDAKENLWLQNFNVAQASACGFPFALPNRTHQASTYGNPQAEACATGAAPPRTLLPTRAEDTLKCSREEGVQYLLNCDLDRENHNALSHSLPARRRRDGCGL